MGAGVKAMDIPVTTERTDDGTYRARALHLCAEGGSPHEARTRIEELVAQFLRAGGEVGSMSVANGSATEDPRQRSYAGCLKDHPLLDEWHEAMAEYRRQLDAVPADADES